MDKNTLHRAVSLRLQGFLVNFRTLSKRLRLDAFST